ncbi:HAMP domain-containing protein [Methylobacillus arboreus]|uniref:HAMP domain-containing sensor histidine kinase n=1 Tax=Methylobacillus arboreus TaxID=755170 RepID=UPI001E426411|nr:ATP-binding protein [Methylobacillus arboreus]MCB5189542.1 HAMP domain-containing protein [Methylobacillus arboreus]
MGRLFWKFFFFFVLAQMTSIIGVSLFFWFSANQASERLERELRSDPMGMALLEAAAGALHHGGEAALSDLLQQWSSKPMPQVYAVNEAEQELLQRPLPSYIDELLDSERGVVIGQAPDGRAFRLFVLDGRHMGARSGRPPGQDMRGGMRPPGPPPEGGRPPPGPQGPIFPWTPVWVGLIASLMFAGLLAWYVSHPIKVLRNAFERAAGGNLKAKVSPAMGRRRDELADLGHGFDRMTEQLDASIQGQKRLLHYVSHEMRSPLARLQVGIGLAKQNPERLESTLDRIEMESVRMDKLLGEVLELSRLESGIMAIKKERLMLGELLEGVVEDARFEASAKHVDIQSNIAINAEIEAQPDLLYRALENILRNAIKYSPDSSEVMLGTRLSNGHIIVAISDSGAGIPEAELGKIFQPFYRADSSGSVTGHGLGLAITKQVLDLHGGSIYLQNRTGGGLLVEVLLPIA